MEAVASSGRKCENGMKDRSKQEGNQVCLTSAVVALSVCIASRPKQQK